MIELSTRAKEAIKTGLAMVIVYDIALRLGWMNPYWAGFAVAMISLPTAGQSLNKGANRMAGTLIGCTAALFIIGLYPQERWSFMLVLSAYIAFCTWKMTSGGRHDYVWQVAGFVCLIICLAGVVSETVFEDAVARTLETGLGIIVYTLVSVFLWPQTSTGKLKEASAKLLATQKQLYQSYRRLMLDGDSKEEYEALRTQEVQLLDQLGRALDAAGSENYEVREVRHLWNRLHEKSTALMETLEQWREGFTEIRRIDLKRILPDLDAFDAELVRRVEEIERMLGGDAPRHEMQVIPLTMTAPALNALTHFEQAALTVTRAQLERLDALSRSLYNCVADLQSFGPTTGRPRPEVKKHTAPVLDLDRLQGIVTVLATLWAAFLVWVYVNPPGHSSLVQLAPTLAFALVQMPQLRASVLYVPFVIGCTISGVIYVLIMPHLSGYAELGLTIFVAWFLITYLFWQPRQALAKLACAVSFLATVKIENNQTYSFAGYANSVAFIFIGISIVAAATYVPVSPRPEKAILRLLTRFFRSCEFSMSRMVYVQNGQDRPSGEWKAAFHQHEMATIPKKLWAWTRTVDYRVLPGTTPAAVRELATSVHVLAFRVKELLETRESPQSAVLVRELLADFRAWRLGIQATFGDWSEAVTAKPPDDLQERLALRMKKLEERISETLTGTEGEELSQEERENFYRLLGRYRGVSEAALTYAERARNVNWEPWEEARF